MVCELENWIYIKWFLGGRQETEPYKYWVTLSCVLPYDLDLQMGILKMQAIQVRLYQ